MSIKNIRRDNMRFLIKKAGTQLDFSRKVGTSAAYVSQVLSEKSRGDVGDKFAHAIEDAYELPRGWLDEDRGGGRSRPGVPVLSDEQVKTVGEASYISSNADHEFIATNSDVGSRTFAYKMNSDEMSPIIPAAAILICEPDLESTPGDIAIITAAGGVFVRRIQKNIDGSIMLKPENLRYPVSVLSDDMKIIAIVRESIVATKFR